jgi:hypothetical protein
MLVPCCWAGEAPEGALGIIGVEHGEMGGEEFDFKNSGRIPKNPGAIANTHHHQYQVLDFVLYKNTLPLAPGERQLAEVIIIQARQAASLHKGNEFIVWDHQLYYMELCGLLQA